MKIESKFIEHICLARQDEPIGVKIVALSPNALLMYGDSSSEKCFFLISRKMVKNRAKLEAHANSARGGESIDIKLVTLAPN